MPPGDDQVADMNTDCFKTIFLKTLTAGLLCTAVTLAPAASAGEAGGQLHVSVTIVASCQFTVDDQTLSFGSVEQDAGSATAQTNLGVRCSAKQPYAIGFDYGQNAQGGQRRMTNGTDGVAYHLYADASHRTPLGPIGSAGAVRGVGNGDEQSVPVYGKLDVPRDTPPGIYNDTVRLTVTW